MSDPTLGYAILASIIIIILTAIVFLYWQSKNQGECKTGELFSVIFFLLTELNCQAIILAVSFSGKLATAKTPC